MPLTQFETDSITSVVVSLQRIADALETIRDRMPEAPVAGGLAELDACDFPCDRKSDHGPEPVPCYLLDEHDNIQPCINPSSMDCDDCIIQKKIAAACARSRFPSDTGDYPT